MPTSTPRAAVPLRADEPLQPVAEPADTRHAGEIQVAEVHPVSPAAAERRTSAFTALTPVLDAEFRTPVSEEVPAQVVLDAALDRSTDASAALVLADSDSDRSRDVDVLVRSTDDVTSEDQVPPAAPSPSTADTDTRLSLEETVERPVDMATVMRADYRRDTTVVRVAPSSAQAALHLNDTMAIATSEGA
jgi:hypothetical protein